MKPIPFSVAGPRSIPMRERGVALVIALVVLLILTIIGVSALVSTALEGMMATNVQEQNRAFQAAEAGIEAALVDPNSYVADAATPEVTLPPIGNYYASAKYASSYIATTNPTRSAIGSGTRFKYKHFQTVSTGTGNIGATTTLTQGLYLIAPNTE